jgi:hypothetical protein
LAGVRRALVVVVAVGVGVAFDAAPLGDVAELAIVAAFIPRDRLLALAVRADLLGALDAIVAMGRAATLETAEPRAAALVVVAVEWELALAGHAISRAARVAGLAIVVVLAVGRNDAAARWIANLPASTLAIVRAVATIALNTGVHGAGHAVVTIRLGAAFAT